MSCPAVLVTGGAQRIGRAIAERFAAGGWHVVVHAREPSEAADAFAAALPRADTIAFDLADPAAIGDAAREIAARHLGWRATICSASAFEPDWPTAVDLAGWDRLLDTNLRGNVLLAQAFLAATEGMAGRVVVNLLDQKLANLNPDFFSYTVAKAALAAAGDMLARARRDVRVMGLAPGLSLPSHDQTEAEFAVAGRMNLLDRYNTPAEIAEAAWFLVDGPLASGTVLFADSGQHLVAQPRDVMYMVREGAV